jgi:D-serine deaminase-like pyridoxal phosphate-dependent protein
MEQDYPILLLDEKKCKTNIQKMAEKARKNNVFFRPHMKTHQSHAVGEWFRQNGTTTITVSSLKMARYFAGAGWDDIFIAFPVNILETERLNRLAEGIHLTLSIESAEVAEHLLHHLTNPVHFMIKIDVGYHRTGLIPQDQEIKRILDSVGNNKNLVFKGFYTHAGQTYQATSKREVLGIYERTLAILTELRDVYRPYITELIISIGDTPSCSLVDDFTGVDEIRPGNFVFYDLMQTGIGVCKTDDVAVALLCPVVAKHPARLELVVHGGAVHLSKEWMIYEGISCYGLVVPYNGTSWEQPVDGVYVHRLSQEHGIIRATPDFFETVKIGDLIGVLPVHSCLTANLAEYYLTTEGNVLRKVRS